MTSPKRIVSSCSCGIPKCRIPYGFCHCGCGQKTGIAKENDAGWKSVKGQPVRFLIGHRYRSKMPDLAAKPFKIDGVYCRLIPLSRGLHAIVDAADYEWLMRWTWCAIISKRSKTFYARCTATGNRMHRIILGCGGTEQPDHINRVGIDNRRNNLRVSTGSQNSQNRPKREDNSTGYRGVHPHHRWYRTQITTKGNRITIGKYDTPEEAARAYDDAARRLHGEFAVTNF